MECLPICCLYGNLLIYRQLKSHKNPLKSILPSSLVLQLVSKTFTQAIWTPSTNQFISEVDISGAVVGSPNIVKFALNTEFATAEETSTIYVSGLINSLMLRSKFYRFYRQLLRFEYKYKILQRRNTIRSEHEG